MYFVQFVVDVGIEQNLFCGGGFVCVNVGIDIDIMVVVDGCSMGYNKVFGGWVV